MTPELLKAHQSHAEDKTRLEDLYLPYKPKRRTKAQIAREAGLEPLADALLANPMLDPEAEAAEIPASPRSVPDRATTPACRTPRPRWTARARS